jgi:hypothetical protein
MAKLARLPPSRPIESVANEHPQFEFVYTIESEEYEWTGRPILESAESELVKPLLWTPALIELMSSQFRDFLWDPEDPTNSVNYPDGMRPLSSRSIMYSRSFEGNITAGHQACLNLQAQLVARSILAARYPFETDGFSTFGLDGLNNIVPPDEFQSWSFPEGDDFNALTWSADPDGWLGGDVVYIWPSGSVLDSNTWTSIDLETEIMTVHTEVVDASRAAFEAMRGRYNRLMVVIPIYNYSSDEPERAPLNQAVDYIKSVYSDYEEIEVIDLGVITGDQIDAGVPTSMAVPLVQAKLVSFFNLS